MTNASVFPDPVGACRTQSRRCSSAGMASRCTVLGSEMSFLSRTSAVRGRTPMDENVVNWLYLGPRIGPAVPESPRWNAACRFLSDPPVLAAERGFTKRHGSFNAGGCAPPYPNPG